MVLWKCVNEYDPERAAGFSTFFWTCAKRRMMDMIARVDREKRKSEWFVLPTQLTHFDKNDTNALCHLLDDNYFGNHSEASAEDWAVIHETILEKWNELPYAKRLRLSDVS